jgi:hypothetical protein
MKIITIIFIFGLLIISYYYHDDLYKYVKPYFDEKRNKFMIIQEENRQKYTMNSDKVDYTERDIKGLLYLPFDFLHKLCVTYGIFPKSSI